MKYILMLIFMSAIPMAGNCSEQAEYSASLLRQVLGKGSLDLNEIGIKPGWTLDTIAESVKGCEASIIESSLKSYLRKAKKNENAGLPFSGKEHPDSMLYLQRLMSSVGNTESFSFKICNCVTQYGARRYSLDEYLKLTGEGRTFSDEFNSEINECGNSAGRK